MPDYVKKLICGMKSVIRILYLEDVPADAAKLDYELLKSGLSFRSQRVDTREDFLRELESQPPDVILSDHGLPAFDGLEALSVAREKCPDVPFIFVTNALSPQMEIEKLVGKVSDYVLKSQLDYLPAAVNRALREASEKNLRKQLLEELRAQFDFATRNKLMLPICSSCKKIRDEENQWKAPEVYFRDLLKIQFTHGLCPDCIPKYFPGKSGKINPLY